jgi:WD40 repeat protein
MLGGQAIGTSNASATFVYGSNNTIVSRSSSTGRVIGRPIHIPSTYGGAIALSPDGRTVALTAGDGVELWDTQTGSQVGAPLPGAPTQPNNPGGPGNLTFTASGRRLLIGSPSGLITIWNLTPSVWARQAPRTTTPQPKSFRSCSVASRALWVEVEGALFDVEQVLAVGEASHDAILALCAICHTCR